MSWPDDKMLGLDLEATSADPYQALPVAFAVGEFDFGQLQGKVRTGLINPGLRIPPESTKVHGITDAMVRDRGGDLFKSGEGLIAYLFRSQKAGAAVTGMNLRYDLTILDTLSRLSGSGLRDRGWQGVVLDVSILDRWVDKYRKGQRNLSALCDHYGVTHGGAHDAGHDVVAAFQVLMAMVKRHPALGEFTLAELQAAQCKAHYEWITHLAEYREKTGGEPIKLDRELGWPLPGELPQGGAPDWPDERPDAANSLMASKGQRTSMILRFKEVGIEDRTERLWVTSEVLGKPVASSKLVTEDEYRQLAAYLQSAAEAGGGPVLAQRARDAVAGGWLPPAVPAAPGGATAAPALDLGPDLDLSGYPKEIVASSMRAVIDMNGAECSEWLGYFSLPKSGKVNDKRLRLLEHLCKLRAMGTEPDMAFGPPPT